MSVSSFVMVPENQQGIFFALECGILEIEVRPSMVYSCKSCSVMVKLGIFFPSFPFSPARHPALEVHGVSEQKHVRSGHMGHHTRA